MPISRRHWFLLVWMVDAWDSTVVTTNNPDESVVYVYANVNVQAYELVGCDWHELVASESSAHGLPTDAAAAVMPVVAANTSAATSAETAASVPFEVSRPWGVLAATGVPKTDAAAALVAVAASLEGNVLAAVAAAAIDCRAWPSQLRFERLPVVVRAAAAAMVAETTEMPLHWSSLRCWERSDEAVQSSPKTASGNAGADDTRRRHSWMRPSTTWMGLAHEATGAAAAGRRPELPAWGSIQWPMSQSCRRPPFAATWRSWSAPSLPPSCPRL